METYCCMLIAVNIDFVNESITSVFNPLPWRFVLQADTLQKQLDRKIVEFKTQEADRELQKKQLTSVVEGLLRKARQLAKIQYGQPWQNLFHDVWRDVAVW